MIHTFLRFACSIWPSSSSQLQALSGSRSRLWALDSGSGLWALGFGLWALARGSGLGRTLDVASARSRSILALCPFLPSPMSHVSAEAPPDLKRDSHRGRPSQKSPAAEG